MRTHTLHQFGAAFVALLCALFALPQLSVAQEAYVAQTDPSTLTFYYDNNRSKHETTWGINDKQKVHGEQFAAWCTSGTETNFDIEKVVLDASMRDYRPTSTRGWFKGLQMLNNIAGMEHLNTSEVVDFSEMFTYCWHLTKIDLSHFDTSKGVRMRRMFDTCTGLQELDLSKFNTSQVVDMYRMFLRCESLTKLNLSSFKLPKLKDAGLLFGKCSSLVWVDITGFPNTIFETESAFEKCTNLTTIYTQKDANWAHNGSYYNNVFKGCINLKGAVAYNPTKVDGDMGNTETGYFTVKPTAIESLKADALAPRAQQGIYTLQGVRLHTDFNHLPAGVYIVNGQKTIKH